MITEPGPGEVLVRVRAAGINFADLMARAGLYPDAPKPACVVGYEFAGELETAAGDLPAGTRVMGGCRFGAYSERVAASGVGIAATQVAKRVGAEVYGTASPAKQEAIASFGVDHPVDYDFAPAVRRIAGDRQPIDLAFDAIGGASFRRSFSLLRPGGRLVCFGASEVQGGERRSPVRAARVLARMPRFSALTGSRRAR